MGNSDSGGSDGSQASWRLRPGRLVLLNVPRVAMAGLATTRRMGSPKDEDATFQWRRTTRRPPIGEDRRRWRREIEKSSDAKAAGFQSVSSEVNVEWSVAEVVKNGDEAP